jgi:hypothetical protein
MSDAPERIYLQWDADEVTWCVDRIDAGDEPDVEYVRADVAAAALRAAEQREPGLDQREVAEYADELMRYVAYDLRNEDRPMRECDEDRLREVVAIAARAEMLKLDERGARALYNGYGRIFPNYAWTDAETAADLLVAEILTLRTELNAARAAEQREAELRDAVARLWVLLDECSDDLWCEVRDRYGDDIHPALQRKYERDMDVVTRAQEAMSLTAPLLPSPFLVAFDARLEEAGDE